MALKPNKSKSDTQDDINYPAMLIARAIVCYRDSSRFNNTHTHTRYHRSTFPFAIERERAAIVAWLARKLKQIARNYVRDFLRRESALVISRLNNTDVCLTWYTHTYCKAGVCIFAQYARNCCTRCKLRARAYTHAYTQTITYYIPESS